MWTTQCVWGSLMIFWAPPMGHFSVLCGTHCSSSKLWQDHSQLLLFLVGILWYWHLQNAEVFCCKDLHFPQQPVIVLLHGAELQLLCMTSSILLLSQRLHLHQWPLLKPQLHVPSCLWNQYHLGSSCIIKLNCQQVSRPCPHLDHSSFLLSKNVPKISPQ